MHAKSLQSCLFVTLWTVACQAPLSMGFSRHEYWSGLPLPSPILLFAILWTIALQATLSVGFSRQEYWHGLPFPPPGDCPNPGIEPVSLIYPALAGRFFTTGVTWEASPLKNSLSYRLKKKRPLGWSWNFDSERQYGKTLKSNYCSACLF